jgi:hypothetical protein
MALARWLAALATSMTVGLLWTRLGRPLPLSEHDGDTPPWRTMLHTVVDDTSSSAGYLAVSASRSGRVMPVPIGHHNYALVLTARAPRPPPTRHSPVKSRARCQ